MSKQIFASVVLALCFAALPSMAAQDSNSRADEIGRALDACIASARSSADGQIAILACLSDAHAKWSKEVDRSYEALLAALPTDKQVVIRESQRSWIKHQKAEWAAIEASLMANHGELPVLAPEYLRLRIARDRAIQLTSYLDLTNE